jgi:hypothetical protein
MLLAAAAVLAGGLPACGTDDAIKRDTKDTRQELDKDAGKADEKAKDAAEDAGDEVKKGVKDVDGY